MEGAVCHCDVSACPISSLCSSPKSPLQTFMTCSSITTSHYDTRYDILKTKSDSDGASVFLLYFLIHVVLKCVFVYCFPVSSVMESILVTVCYLLFKCLCFLVYFEGSLSCIVGMGLCRSLLPVHFCCISWVVASLAPASLCVVTKTSNKRWQCLMY